MPDSLVARLELPSPGLALLLGQVRRMWLLLVLSPVLGLVLAAGALHVFIPQYTASMVVGPTGRSGPVGMGLRVPTANPVAARGLAEQGTPEELISDFSRYLALLTSVPVAESLTGDEALMRRLFPADWDEQAQQWQPPSGLGARLTQGLRWLAGQKPWMRPDAVDLSRHLKRYLVVDRVGEGPLRRLSYRHQDRDFAMALLARLHAATETHLRVEAQRRLRAEMGHVGKRLTTLSNMDNSRALSGLVAEQERVLLMLDVGLPYAADALETPSALSLPDWPNPVLMLPTGAVAGLTLALFFIGVRHGWRRE
ncbi:hypothetical protein [Niveispirillum irakense]|uniref:hypothetical protein n=1 Tax=Niveispirillum irakense TaxID=34011 RepID=UPI0012B56A16|nr:hypothetical protein [Niveispirillum irakense]